MATFIMREMDGKLNGSRRQRYPHLLKTGEVTLRQMAEDIAGGSTFTPGDVMGVVRAVAGRIARYAAQGLTVRVEGMGSFRASLKVDRNVEEETAASESHRTAKSVRVGGMCFRADREMIDEAERWASLSRRLPRKDEREPMSPEERMAALRSYLEEHPFIRVRDYCLLTGLKPYAAKAELRRLREAGDAWIDTLGSGPHKVYVLKPAQAQEGGEP